MKTWRPSKTQRRDFAIKMQTDEQFAAEYNQRKISKAEKKRAGSQFDYSSAGGKYIPTEFQYQTAIKILMSDSTDSELRNSANLVLGGFSCSETVHHDHIHRVNQYFRNL